MKKVLIITYYWPPTGGSGVQRWLKFARYLPEFGYEPVIFTPENPSFINMDPALLNEVAPETEVLKLPIWEPYALVGKGAHQKNVNVGKPKGLRSKIANWIRGNVFIPDPRRFWIRPASHFLINFLPGSGINTIITTGPPHSMHLIGLRVKKKVKVRWIADFRDPWTEWDIMDGFMLSSLSKKIHRSLEKKVLQNADRVISVGWHMDKDLKRLGAKRSHVITNGFDPADFQKDSLPNITPPTDRFVIRHVGTIDEMRNPRPFLNACLQLKKYLKLKEVKIAVEFIGNVNPTFQQDVESHSEWSEFTTFHQYVPHSEVPSLYRSSHVLLLVLAHSHSAKLNVTGKIFEYMASGVPVIAIGDPEGDGAKVLKESGAGKVVPSDDVDGMIKTLLTFYESGSQSTPDLDKSPYSRRNLTGQLAKILDAL